MFCDYHFFFNLKMFSIQNQNCLWEQVCHIYQDRIFGYKPEVPNREREIAKPSSAANVVFARG